MRGKSFVAAAVALWLSAAPMLPALAEGSLEEKRDEYERQAAEKLRESQELQTQIDSVSEEKRVIDAEADAAIAEYRARRDELYATEDRIDENRYKIKLAEADYRRKNKVLGKRVRDIYINGQLSYLDVLFGAKDFMDFMTRMDLLKRVIKEDYDLVQAVLADKAVLEEREKQLEKDEAAQKVLVDQAAEAKRAMEEKQARRQAIIDRMTTDKAVYDQQYNELMAASKEITNMILERQRQAEREARASSAGSSYSALPAGGGSGAMIWPVAGVITSEFGWRTHPIFGSARFHSGIDIGSDYGAPICAAASGTVIHAGWIGGYGNTVIIDHGGGISSLYGHNQSLAVGEGQSVSQGQVIAYCGSTGNSTGPHCHFEVRQGGEPVSPYGFL